MHFLTKALDIIFLPTCGICGKINEGYLCNGCKNKIINSNIYLNQLDTYNDKSVSIKEHFYLFSYSGIIRKKLLEYKFFDKPYLSEMFYEFFINNEKLYRFFKKYDIMQITPISKKRLYERGYNQSALIAKKIAKLVAIQFEKDLLVKAKNNTPQSNLNQRQRLENVKGVYKTKNEQIIKEKNILLFDDIYTTGATANECAKALFKAGAKSVGILTIAKDFKTFK